MLGEETSGFAGRSRQRLVQEAKKLAVRLDRGSSSPETQTPDDIRSDDQRYQWSTRPEIQPAVPRGIASLLDIGCSSGGFAAGVKAGQPGVEVWGIEPDPVAAEQARQSCDVVIVGYFPDSAPGRTFDCVTFNDVLEHLPDPWTTLAATHALLAEGGCVVACIPNMRFWPVLKDLVLRARWDYADTGVLDRTHLRWFTKATMLELFEQAGFTVELVIPVDNATTRSLRLLNIVSGGRFADAAHQQFVFRAWPAEPPAQPPDPSGTGSGAVTTLDGGGTPPG